MGAQSVMTSQAVAARFGLHTTDLECLDLIYSRQHAGPAELARATGLTSGAMTALLDRLERAGYVVRSADPGDRRRFLIRIRPEAIEPIKAVYQPIQAEMLRLWSSFSTDDLRIITAFLSRSTDLAVACTARLSSAGASSPSGRRRPRTRPREGHGIAPTASRARRCREAAE